MENGKISNLTKEEIMQSVDIKEIMQSLDNTSQRLVLTYARGLRDMQESMNKQTA